MTHKPVRCVRVREIGDNMDNDLRTEIPLMPRFLKMIKQVYQVAISFTEAKTSSNRYHNNLVAIAR